MAITLMLIGGAIAFFGFAHNNGKSAGLQIVAPNPSQVKSLGNMLERLRSLGLTPKKSKNFP
jgi:hypothetical protein